MSWRGFFESTRAHVPGQDDPQALKVMWAEAEQLSTERGQRRAAALGLGPSSEWAQFMVRANAWRGEIIENGPLADDPVFDPRSTGPVFEYVDWIFRWYEGLPYSGP